MAGKHTGINNPLRDEVGMFTLEICLWMFVGFIVVILYSRLSAKSYLDIAQSVSQHNLALRP